MQNLVKPLSMFVIFGTTLGVLMHDIHIDKTAAIFSLPAYIASTGALERSLSPNYHTHVERASLPRTGFGASLPNAQPPREDGRKYLQNKKLSLSGGGDAVSYWPSV